MNEKRIPHFTEIARYARAKAIETRGPVTTEVEMGFAVGWLAGILQDVWTYSSWESERRRLQICDWLDAHPKEAVVGKQPEESPVAVAQKLQ